MLGGEGVNRVLNVERRRRFREYLLEQYRSHKTGRPLSRHASSDVCSRCRRVESVMGVDLDEVLVSEGLDKLLVSMSERESEFKFRNNPSNGITGLRSAVRLYSVFLKTEQRRARRDGKKSQQQ